MSLDLNLKGRDRGACRPGSQISKSAVSTFDSHRAFSYGGEKKKRYRRVGGGGWKNSLYFIIGRITKDPGMDLSFGNQRLDILFNLILSNSHSF